MGAMQFMLKEMYTCGDYLEKNPTWHIEDSPYKMMGNSFFDLKSLFKLLEKKSIKTLSYALKTLYNFSCS